MSPEPYYTISQFAPMTGFPPAFIRNACNRAKGFHPLPCIKSGKKRPTLRVCMSDWLQWLDEEKGR